MANKKTFNTVTFDALATLRNGKALDTSEYATCGTVPVYGSNGQIATTNQILNARSVIAIGRVGAYCGSTHLIQERSWVTDNAIIAEPREGVDLRFLFYRLNSLDLRRTAIGSAQPLMTQSGLKVIETIAPTYEVQRRIAHILGTLDDKIELNRRMNETLEGMARALFKSWFVDFDPVRAKLDGRQPPGMDTATAALFPDRFEHGELGLVPEGWRVGPLPDAVEVNPRRSLRKGEVAPYLDMKSMPTAGHRAEGWIDRELGSGTKFIGGDTLLARITPCLENGKTAFVDFLDDGQVGWGSTEYIIFHPKPPLPVEFGYYLARSEGLRLHAIQNMTGTSGRQRVPPTCFDQFPLVIPPAPVAERFGELVRPLMRRITANCEQSSTLGMVRDSLLPKLLSGEIRAGDVEMAVEDVA